LDSDPLPANRYRVEALDRGLVLLNALANLGSASAAQLAQAANANRSLVYRMLNTLADRGFVVRDRDNIYRLGPRLLYLGQQAQLENLLVDASRDILERLRNDTKENTALIVRDGLQTIGQLLFLSPLPVRLSTNVGARGELHTSGAGKLLLAFQPPELIESVIAAHLGEFIPAALTTRELVLAYLEQIRQRGYYEAVGENHPDVYTLSAPVRDGDGSVVAAAAILGPLIRLTPEKRAHDLRLVREAAEQISNRLGSSLQPSG
jgi:IclR family acetate operon transcriptional repressor